MARRILVVDDERDLVLVTKVCLERAGYEVATAYDGSEALERVADTRPSFRQ